MEQIAVNFTDGWVPKTWLTPLATIIDLNGNVMVENGVCKELGYWWYIYNFNRYSPEKVYLYVFDWWDTLSSDYDRYKFWGNELDAYSNKYSWGRTAAPYFTSVNGRFDRIDKAFKDAEKNKYKDTEVIKNLKDIKKQIKWSSVNTRLNQLEGILQEIKKSVVDTSATNDWNSSKNFSGINGKLDLMAEYIVKMKNDVDNELNSLDENVAQRITDSNATLSEWFSKNITIEQLLQQVQRLDDKMEEVLNTFMTTNLNWQLPKELVDKYSVSLNRKWMSDEEVMAALGIPENEWNQYWLNQWMNEWMDMWMSEWLWETREQWVNAPVDMQWIAEPEMPLNY